MNAPVTGSWKDREGGQTVILTPEKIHALWIQAGDGEPRDVADERVIKFANLVWEENEEEVRRQVKAYMGEGVSRSTEGGAGGVRS
jgi:hypothetical protein